MYDMSFVKRKRAKVGTLHTCAEKNDETIHYSDMEKSTILLSPHHARKSNFRSGCYKNSFKQGS